MENTTKSITSTSRLAFAGITQPINIKETINSFDSPFESIERKLVERDKEELKHLIYNYNKHANELAKIFTLHEF